MCLAQKGSRVISIQKIPSMHCFGNLSAEFTTSSNTVGISYAALGGNSCFCSRSALTCRCPWLDYANIAATLNGEGGGGSNEQDARSSEHCRIGKVAQEIPAEILISHRCRKAREFRWPSSVELLLSRNSRRIVVSSFWDLFIIKTVQRDANHVIVILKFFFLKRILHLYFAATERDLGLQSSDFCSQFRQQC